jgi:Leucine-rich repeat (LRR) protein
MRDNPQLAMLPRDIGVLRNLKKLDCYGNRMKTLPPEIGQLSNLSILDLR